MEKISISRNSKVNTLKTLNVQNMMIVDGRLRLHLIDDSAKQVNVGDKIILTRYFKDSNIKQITREVYVYEKLDDSNIIVSQPNRLLSHRVVDSNVSFSEEEWSSEVPLTINFEDRLDLYKRDVATAKRHDKWNQVIVTFTNSSRPLETVTKINPFVIDDETNVALTIPFTKEEFEIVDDTATTMTISTNEFYDIDYNNYCHPWDECDDTINITFSISNMYYNVPIFVGNDVDHVGLNMEASLSKMYEEEYKSKLIPEIIDLEKVKFLPMVISGKTTTFDDNPELLKECYTMHFKFHFRSRKADDESWSIDNQALYPWYQGINESNMKSKSTEIAQSDLLGCLGFTDEDVANQKMKLKKTFIRLSFYSSTDMAEQKLLFYSTVFLDTNELHDKYLNLINMPNMTGSMVDYSGSVVNYEDRLTSEITITSAYNNKKSSEGFYLYLFKTDEFTPDPENTVKTIYMKVEFNHAKYGRTIPMLIWPGNGQYLTPANYFSSLYIPVKLMYNNGKYLYYFPKNVTNDIEEDTSDITFTLFEPRLIMQTSRN